MRLSPSKNVLALVAFSLPLVACAARSADESVAVAAEAATVEQCPDTVPAALTPGADQSLEWVFTGEGVQIYSCNATATAQAWTLVGPDAELLNNGGHVEGTHFVGPTWESEDGSFVVGAKVAAAPSPDGAIPWLLLKAVSHGGPDGRFSDVTSIQRLETSGGVAPATGCDADHLGATVSVGYTARYFLYQTKDHGNVKQCGD